MQLTTALEPLMARLSRREEITQGDVEALLGYIGAHPELLTARRKELFPSLNELLRELLNQGNHQLGRQCLAALLPAYADAESVGLRARLLWFAVQFAPGPTLRRRRVCELLQALRQRLAWEGNHDVDFHWWMVVYLPEFVGAKLSQAANLLPDFSRSLSELVSLPGWVKAPNLIEMIGNLRYLQSLQGPLLQELASQPRLRRSPLLALLRAVARPFCPGPVRNEKLPEGVRTTLTELAAVWARARSDFDSLASWSILARETFPTHAWSATMRRWAAWAYHRQGRYQEGYHLYCQLTAAGEGLENYAPAAAACAAACGRAQEALDFLGEQGAPHQRGIYLRMAGRKDEFLQLPEGMAKPLEPYWAMHSRMAREPDATRRLELDSASELLSPDQIAGIQGKLARSDLICHPMKLCRRIPGQIVLQPMLLHSSGVRLNRELILQALDASTAFWARELSGRGPRFVVAEPCEAVDDQLWRLHLPAFESNARGVLRKAFPNLRKPGVGLVQIAFLPCPNARSWGLGFLNLTAICVGGLQDYLATVIAHELGHVVFGLDDVDQTTFPLEGDLSLMGYQWDGPPEQTYVGLRSRAACLTPPAAYRACLAGLAAEKRQSWPEAAQHFRLAWETDPWNLAAGTKAVASLYRAYGPRRTRKLASEILINFPSLRTEFSLSEWTDQRRLRVTPEEVKSGDRQFAVHFYLSRDNMRDALKVMRDWPQPEAPVLHHLGLQSLVGWRLGAARSWFSQALGLCQDDREALEVLGIISCHTGHLDRARDYFRRCGPRTTMRARFYLSLAEANWPRALKIARAPSSEWLFWHALLSYKTGRVEDARSSSASALEQVQSGETGLLKAFDSLYHGQLEEAARQARRGLRVRSLRPFMLDLLAFLEPEGPWRARLQNWLPAFPTVLSPRESSSLRPATGSIHPKGSSCRVAVGETPSERVRGCESPSKDPLIRLASVKIDFGRISLHLGGHVVTFPVLPNWA